ncbi:MAG TPA: addiction module protein [Bacillota bacterium]|nr:addiction module protein [Bacillota bacterium]
MKVEAVKVEDGFLIPFNGSLGQIKDDKILLDIEIIEPDQFAEGYAILDKMVGFCESSQTDALVNHEAIASSISAPPGFADLSKPEQIRFLQELWDQIAEQPGEVPVPESHLKLVEERIADYRRDPASAHSAYEVLDRLTKKHS